MINEENSPAKSNVKKDRPNKKPQLKLDPEEQILRKRLPPGMPKGKTDVYVNNKTPYKVGVSYCVRTLKAKVT